MPSVELTTTLAGATAVASSLGGYLAVGLAVVLGPRLLKQGFRMIKGR